MFLTNHVMAGTLLGLVIDNPYVLAPTAIASHLAMDMIPHFGLKSSKGANFHTPGFLVLGSIDFVISVSVVITACLVWPQRALNILVGAVGAALPDLTYIPVIVFGNRWYGWVRGYKEMIGFLGRIQLYEKTPGLVTEVLAAALLIMALRLFLPL